jgi:hypothetical protein
LPPLKGLEQQSGQRWLFEDCGIGPTVSTDFFADDRQMSAAYPLAGFDGHEPAPRHRRERMAERLLHLTSDQQEGAPVTKTSARLLVWAPRVLGASICLFLGLLAFDVFGEGKTWLEALPGFVIHLVPAVLLCGIVVASWNREWIGGTVFTVVGLAYIGLARERLDWVLVVSGPLLAVGALFLLGWRHHGQIHTARAHP